MEALEPGAVAPVQAQRRRPAIVFVGFMGAGKTTAARSVAAELGVRPLDTDKELEAELGEPIEQYFDREGEDAFRARERATVLALLERPDAEVVALGGGSLASEDVREALREHVVVHLDVEADDAWRRASGRGRPLARDRGRFEDLLSERRSVYEAAADVVLPAAERDTPRRALASVRALQEPEGRGLRMVWAQSESAGYPVFFGNGLRASGFFHPPAGRRFVVTDENVMALHPPVGDRVVAIPPGESQKTLGRAEAVLRELALAGATRDDVVVAYGGGVVGDLGGFCAAVYQRGVRCVQMPTTLVAQVDSAYGGKTGVDLPEAKNYVGAYHHPASVLVDPSLLQTLPPEEAAAGYAEVVKTALIAGGALWARVREGGPVDEDTILGCIRTKLAVVTEDERDEGRRQVLNLGHTFAHALETATGYSRYRHGEAVALGLLVALRLSDREQLRAEVSELFAARGLPVRFEGASVDRLLELMERDKKRREGRVPFVLLEAPGAVTPGHAVDRAALAAAVEELRAA